MTVLRDVNDIEQWGNDPAKARIAELEAMVAKLKAGRQSKLTLKVSKAGAISIYGFGKWPVTLYRQQMEKLLTAKDDILAFIEANTDLLSVKE